MTQVVQFREVFARYPAGVVIVTTRDEEGVARGFTASSFTSVSADPPLVLACLNLTAECYPVFATAEKFAISILRPHHQELAERFAKRGVEKFVEGYFVDSHHGLPVVHDALATLICKKADQFPGGDHVILVGEVTEALLGDPGHGMVHYQRRFWGVGDGALSQT
ncbi:MAG: flavin reductase family protein [Xanthobacteraceae bacterium]